MSSNGLPQGCTRRASRSGRSQSQKDRHGVIAARGFPGVARTTETDGGHRGWGRSQAVWGDEEFCGDQHECALGRRAVLLTVEAMVGLVTCVLPVVKHTPKGRWLSENLRCRWRRAGWGVGAHQRLPPSAWPPNHCPRLPGPVCPGSQQPRAHWCGVGNGIVAEGSGS